MERKEFVRHFQNRAARTSLRNWFRWTWARLLGRVAVALIIAGPAIAGNYEAGNYDGSFGDVGTDGDYGHTYDACGNECGNEAVYVGPGPIGGSTSSRSYGGSYGLDGGAYENRR